MNRKEALEQYEKALKMGQKSYRAAVAAGISVGFMNSFQFKSIENPVCLQFKLEIVCCIS